MALTQADPSGGVGFFEKLGGDLLDTITGGLKVVAAGELAQKYGFGFGAENYVVDAEGNVRYAGAPAKPVNNADKAAEAIGNPIVIAALVAAGIVVTVLLLRRR